MSLKVYFTPCHRSKYFRCYSVQLVSIHIPERSFSFVSALTLTRLFAFTPTDAATRIYYHMLTPLEPEPVDVADAPVDLLERVAHVYSVGFMSQWRMQRRFFFLAEALSPLLSGKNIVFYGAENIDRASRDFFSVLSGYASVNNFSLSFIYGAAPEGEFVILPIYAEREERLCEMMAKKKLNEEESVELTQYGFTALSCGNMWLAHDIYEVGAVRGVLKAVDWYYAAVSALFLGDTLRAQFLYERARDRSREEEPREGEVNRLVTCAYALYGLAVLHLRYLPVYARSFEFIEQCMREGAQLIEEYGSTDPDFFLPGILLEAARGLILYRNKQLHDALVLMSTLRARLEPYIDYPEARAYASLFLGNTALVYHALEMPEAARACQEQARSYNYYTVIYWVEECWSLLKMKRYDEAEACAREALVFDHISSELYAVLETCAQVRGDLSMAGEMRRKVQFYKNRNF